MGSIKYEIDGKVAVITIVGDTDLNLLALDMAAELARVLAEFRDDRNLSVALVQGEGDRAFSAGGDLRGPIELTPDLFTPESNRDWVWWPRGEPRAATERLITLEVDKPIVAAVNGYCLGLSFMFLCQVTDIRIAGAGASFGFTETRQGLSGGAATSQILRHVMPGVGMYLALTGDRISAEEALRAGLLAKVVPDDEMRTVAFDIARRISELPIEVLKAEKEGAIQSRDRTRKEAFRLSSLLYTLHVQQPDAYDRVRAFFDQPRTTDSSKS